MTNNVPREVDGVNLVVRIPAGLQFSGSADSTPGPTTYCNGTGNCTGNLEVAWNIGAMAASSTKTITVNANVLNTLTVGSLLVWPTSVTATGFTDVLGVSTTLPTHN